MSKLINGDYSFAYPNFLGNQNLSSDIIVDSTTGNKLTTELANITSELNQNMTLGTTSANTIIINSGSTTYNNNEVIKIKDNSTGSLKLQCNDAGPTDLMIINTTNGAESLYLPFKYSEIGNVASGVVQIGDVSNVGETNLFGVVAVKNNITIGSTNANTITINSGSTTYINNEAITLKDNSTSSYILGSAGNTNMLVLDTSDASSNVNLSSATNLIINNTNDAASYFDITSALVVKGGIACAKRIIGGNISANGNLYASNNITSIGSCSVGSLVSSGAVSGTAFNGDTYNGSSWINAGQIFTSVGISLPTIDGTVAILNYYERSTVFPVMFQSTGAGGTTAIVNIFLTRIGNIVQIQIPDMYINANGGSITSNPGYYLPTRFCPNTTGVTWLDFPIHTINIGSYQDTGTLSIKTTGQILIYKSNIVPYFGIGAGSGITSNTNITYQIQ